MSILEQTAMPSVRPPVLITDLLADAGTLSTRLGQALRDEQWTDAYLFSAGLGQLLDDRLHADPFLLNRAARYLRGQPSRPARLAGAAAGLAGKVMRLVPRTGERRLRRAKQPLADLTARLAAQVIASRPPGSLAPLLRAVLPAIPALTGDQMRIPSCFHSFDQHPDDVRWLTAEFRRHYPALGTPLCIVGVRTSGSYLGPLVAAALRAAGYSAVALLTYRPGQPFLPAERGLLTATAGAGGLILVCDDPPGTGTSLAATARDIARAGVPDSRIVFLLSLFGSAGDIPAVLSPWRVVAQPWEEWSIHGRLAGEPVREALAGLLGPGTEVSQLQPRPVPAALATRGHVRARYGVRLTDRQSGESRQRDILVEGSGLGYFGREALAVAAALPGKVPHVYGYADGLLYRDWLPVGSASVPSADLAEIITDYVVSRRRTLPAPFASTARLGGRDPAWEVAAKLVSRQYGRLAVPARPLLLDPVMRRLLRHEHPTVVDGNTHSRHWLPEVGSTGRLQKVDFHQQTFSNLDLTCYDPIFDLAGAAADPPSPRFEAQLRSEYEHATGDRVDGERWLLYRLAHLWRLGRAGELDADQVRFRSAEAVHDYLAALYLHDLPQPSADGAICAIDLDGVLECDALGYPVTSPTGVLALRALLAHGYQPVLASGRSLPDVRSRCMSFGLVGGIAEYGSVLFAGGTVTDLRSHPDRDLLEQVRGALQSWPGVRVDPQYQYGIRIRSSEGPGPADLLARVHEIAGLRARIIDGQDQTDITTAGADKAVGLAALRAQLGGVACALAVGDSTPDLAMLAEASLARAPGNSSLTVDGTQVATTRGSYQFGLAEAVADLIGHRPGRCPACHPPAFASRTEAMLAILDLRANGLATLPARTAALGTLMMRRNHWRTADLPREVT